MGVSGYFEQDVNLGKSIPYSFRLPLGVEPTTLTGQVNEAISDYIEFDSIPEASSVWFRYILEDRDTSIDLANHVGQDVIYVKDVVDSNGNRALPSEHGPLEPLILAQLHDGNNTVPDLVRANPGGWETLPPAWRITPQLLAKSVVAWRGHPPAMVLILLHKGDATCQSPHILNMGAII